MGFVFVYITNPDRKVARKVSRHLLKKKLIACANIYSAVESKYWWKGKIERTKEVIVIAKTLNKNYNKIVKEVRKVHTYKVPCITKISVSANKDYEAWMRKVIK
jgi:periplasmic divalent cation tolerance protein